jgi:hypothetical protein
MNPGFLTRRGLRAGAVLLGVASVLGCAARAEVSPPIKLALFDFELEDFSAAGALPGSTDPKHPSPTKRADWWHSRSATASSRPLA